MKPELRAAIWKIAEAAIDMHENKLNVEEFEEFALSALNQVKDLNITCNISTSDIPEWLTPERIAEVKTIYNSHVFGDSMRVTAIQTIRNWSETAGYTIGPKKANEILHQYCL